MRYDDEGDIESDVESANIRFKKKKNRTRNIQRDIESQKLLVIPGNTGSDDERRIREPYVQPLPEAITQSGFSSNYNV